MSASCSLRVWGSRLKFINFRSFNQLSLNHENFIIRSISTSSVNCLKEIRRHETENQIVIEGVKTKSDRTGKVINLSGRRGCPLCQVGIRNLKHTDILIISQFINSDGTMIPQFITGLCNKQHVRVRRAVVLAQRAGLIDKAPGTPVFGDWELNNTYFKKF